MEGRERRAPAWCAILGLGVAITNRKKGIGTLCHWAIEPSIHRAIGSFETETRNSKLETRQAARNRVIEPSVHRRIEDRNSKLETRNWKFDG
jgi:hypothetical protein